MSDYQPILLDFAERPVPHVLIERAVRVAAPQQRAPAAVALRRGRRLRLEA